MSGYLEIDHQMTFQEKRQQGYREKYKTMKPTWDDSIMLLSRLFEECAQPDMVVLDAGCGRSNYVLKQNKKFIQRIAGIDAEKRATDGNVIADEILIGDLEKMPFDSNRFDAVVSLWVLEHMEHPERVFSEVSRVLKPGGRFFFVTPYSYSYILIAKRIVGTKITRRILDAWYGRTEEDTFHTYYLVNTEKDIRRQASSVGLTEKILITNEDPSYLALNTFFFYLALFIQRIADIFHFRIAKMHVIGVFEKAESPSVNVLNR